MPEQRYCDLCGRSETDLLLQNPGHFPALEIDPDGLWMCSDCRARLVTSPVEPTTDADLSDEIQALVGKSAGAISSTLNLPHEPPYRSIAEAAHRIAYDQDMFMSAWSFVTQWIDGTTVWRAEDGSATAVVPLDGPVRIEAR